jgi:extracellular elastinolytic metalloproteinase
VTLTQGDFASKEIKARLQYIQADGELRLVWNVNADTTDNWFDAFVNADNSQVEAVLDWVHYASYNVYPIGVNDPDDGVRTIETDPATSKASPLGWHDQGDAQFTTTIGNNVYAQENWSGSTGSGWVNNYRPNAGASLNFDYPIDFRRDPTENIDAAVTNLFYWNNVVHDVLYEYGFDEVSGNFQENNFNNGGLGDDAVQANAQDGAGYNNANFATPPDGQRPRMRMYVWTTETPYLDGDYDNGIIIHEYAHGISNRLTGGPSNTGCLGSGEAGGMGEGWYVSRCRRVRGKASKRLRLTSRARC